MDGKLWNVVYQTVMTINHPNPRESVTHTDRVIVLVILRASYDNQSINWACRSDNWNGLARPNRLPSQPTMSRRSNTPQVQALLSAVEEWLRQRGPCGEPVVAIDGRPLTINPHSKDPDARWGYAIKGLDFGYKFHAIWGLGPVPLAWELQPLNVSESVLAATKLVPKLAPAEKRQYILGDAAYDTNPLHAAVAAQRYQLLAPPKRTGKGVGHRVHDPARLRSLSMLQTPYGKRLYRKRTMIERQFGNAAMRAEGLGELPAHVRRLHRVRNYVHAKVILNGFRILMNHNALPLAA